MTLRKLTPEEVREFLLARRPALAPLQPYGPMGVLTPLRSGSTSTGPVVQHCPGRREGS
jgi:hypothetical protein